MNYPSLIKVPCNLCGSSSAEVIYTGPDRMLGHPGEWSLMQCRHCGLIYLNPRPSEMSAYYAGDYLPFVQRARHQLIPRRQSAPEAVSVGAAGGYYDLVRQATTRTSGQLLDVGCATGDFLVVMAAAGWEVTGCDVNAQAVEQARNRLSGYQFNHVIHGSLEEAAFPSDSFDLITLWHSIEHLPDPLATLREAWRVLRPDGLLIMQTPAWLSLESQLWKGYWAGLDCPRHLYIFSPKTLTAMLQMANLRIVRRLHQTSYYFWVISLLFFAQQMLSPRLLGGLYRLLSKGPIMMYFSPFFRIIDRDDQESLLTVVARKQTL